MRHNCANYFQIRIAKKNYHNFAIKSSKIYFTTHWLGIFPVLLHCFRVWSDENASMEGITTQRWRLRERQNRITKQTNENRHKTHAADIKLSSKNENLHFLKASTKMKFRSLFRRRSKCSLIALHEMVENIEKHDWSKLKRKKSRLTSLVELCSINFYHHNFASFPPFWVCIHRVRRENWEIKYKIH